MDYSKVKFLGCLLGVRYWEDAAVNGLKECNDAPTIPLRTIINNRYGKDQEYWNIKVNIETGKILDWPHGTVASVHYKVCDDCYFTLFDKNMEVMKKVESYVPSAIDLYNDSFGDYIIFDIDEEGMIQDWRQPSQQDLSKLVKNAF